MPARESFLQSHGAPQTYRLKRGGQVELRNGRLYQGTEPIGNGDPVGWLREHAVLTEDQAYWLKYVVGGG